MLRSAPPSAADPVSEVSGTQILVLFEPGPAGVAAVELARDLALHGNATVTVVGIAPRAPKLHCVGSARAYDDAVRDAVARELEQAEELLWPIGSRGECRLLTEGSDPPLQEFVARERFDLVLLPAHRRPLRSAKHPAADALRRSTAAEVRIVDAR
jgi:nucleotide-binding universal stress UspA family protein